MPHKVVRPAKLEVRTLPRAPLRPLRGFTRLTSQDRSLYLKTWLTLVVISALLEVLGYDRTHRLLSYFLPLNSAPVSNSKDILAYACRVGSFAQIAGRYIPLNGTCLRQSLTVWWLLRLEALPAELRIGVNCAEDFKAHAWVELNDRPINDGVDVSKRFSAFSRVC